MQVLAAAEALAITTTGAWTEVDLTGAPYSVPTTATFALLHVVLKKATAPGITFQVRSAASSQDICGAAESNQDYTATSMSVLAPLSAGKFDYYTDGTTAGGTIDVAVIGYFSALDGASFNSSIDITPADPGLPAEHPLLEGWETINVGAYVPSTFNLAVCSYHDSAFGPDNLSIANDTIRHSFDVRVTGGSAVISETADQYGGLAVGTNSTQYFLAPLDSLGRFDIYGYAPRTAAVSRTLLLHGYLKATLNASPASTDANVFVAPSSAAWLERTASVAARAVLVYFANSDAWNAVLGYRMFGEAGTHVTSMQDGEVVRGIQQAVVPLDANSKWEEWEEYSGTYAGTRSHTIAYFLTEELLEESSTITDTLEQDVYTREVSESASITDTLAVGDITSDTITESSTPSDTLVVDHAKGAVATEMAAISDTIEVERTRDSLSDDIQIDFIVITSDSIGLYGNIGSAPELAIVASIDSEGLFGQVGTPGTTNVECDLAEDIGLWGGISTLGTLNVEVDTDADGAWGGIGSGTPELLVSIDYLSANAAGFLGENDEIPLYVDIDTSTGFGAIAGSGTCYIAVELTLDSILPTGLGASETKAWHVFPMNLKGLAPTLHDTAYNSMCVIGSNVYAASSSGLHLIGGHTDNGTAIQATIGKYGTDFGSSLEKTITDAHFRILTNGNLTTSVASDRGNGTATLVDGISHYHGSTLNLPRGSRGREHSFVVRNVDGSYFEISELELLMFVSGNRRGRRVRG